VTPNAKENDNSRGYWIEGEEGTRSGDRTSLELFYQLSIDIMISRKVKISVWQLEQNACKVWFGRQVKHPQKSHSITNLGTPTTQINSRIPAGEKACQASSLDYHVAHHRNTQQLSHAMAFWSELPVASRTWGSSKASRSWNMRLDLRIIYRIRLDHQLTIYHFGEIGIHNSHHQAYRPCAPPAST
jgi:hypothetical protein